MSQQPIIVYPGQTVQKPQGASRPYQFDWTRLVTELDASAQISSSAWSIEGEDAALTKDNESVVTGNLKTQVRLIGGTPGKVYKLTNTITTNETPANIDQQYLWVKIPIETRT